ncbi:MAG: hypothetical protein KIG95_03485 [Comamonas sp.]|nr:hypothetical protein [Comamonas sp.]
MIDKKALSDALTKAFIGYQHRLDCPMPIPHETEEMTILKYRTDPIFHAKVKSLVSGVMQIVGEHLDGEPAPDASVLVEALELISDTDPDEETAWFHDIAHKALESYRKGGES